MQTRNQWEEDLYFDCEGKNISPTESGQNEMLGTMVPILHGFISFGSKTDEFSFINDVIYKWYNRLASI